MHGKIVENMPAMNDRKSYEQEYDFMKKCPFLKQPEDVTYSTESIYLEGASERCEGTRAIPVATMISIGRVSDEGESEGRL